MRKNNTSLYLTALFAIILLIGVGYAYLTANLNINGQAKIKKATWDVHFENIKSNNQTLKFRDPNGANDNSLTSSIGKTNVTSLTYQYIPVSSNETTWHYDGALLSADIVNSGSIPATVSKGVVVPIIPSPLDDLLTVRCYYSTNNSTWSSLSSEMTDGSVLIYPGTSIHIRCDHNFTGVSHLNEAIYNALQSNDYTTIELTLSIPFRSYG